MKQKACRPNQTMVGRVTPCAPTIVTFISQTRTVLRQYAAAHGVTRPAFSLLLPRSVLVLLFLCCVERAIAADDSYLNLQPQRPGDHALHILSPQLLELDLVNTKQPDPARVDSWDWVNTNGDFAPPSFSSLRVVVNGRTNA